MVLLIIRLRPTHLIALHNLHLMTAILALRQRRIRIGATRRKTGRRLTELLLLLMLLECSSIAMLWGLVASGSRVEAQEWRVASRALVLSASCLVGLVLLICLVWAILLVWLVLLWKLLALLLVMLILLVLLPLLPRLLGSHCAHTCTSSQTVA